MALNLGSETDVARQERQLKAQAIIEQQELAALMRIPAMRRFLWTMLEKYGMHRNPFHGEGTHDTAFDLGMQNAGKILIREIEDGTCKGEFSRPRSVGDRGCSSGSDGAVCPAPILGG